ncbi:gtpase-activating protein [Anaeramoeba ignava]|uniref:Gtpase-activating protein n=1 Tax=Anaeramoeba ignava TaxID=1746090 RepID=A0A9Q0LX25_ANAIG|nr:gtpase-activating protein [Anaeramoeba ignava]
MTNIPDFLNPNKEKIEKNNEIETNIIQTPKIEQENDFIIPIPSFGEVENKSNQSNKLESNKENQNIKEIKKKETKETNYNKIYQTKNPEIQPQITSGNYQKDLDDLNQLKRAISVQSKKNFEIEKEIKQLDQKIALLIKNRITLNEVQISNIEDQEEKVISIKDERVRDQYSGLFYLMYHMPKYIATVTRYVNPGECEKLLQIVMFTIYGNHYDQREEKLLLNLFELALYSEFKNCTHTNTLLRANTTITKLLFTYTRRGPGQLYLKKLLADHLQAIASDEELNLEINPVRIYEQWVNEEESRTGITSEMKKKVTYEEAAEHPKVIELLGPRVLKLQELFNDLLQLIADKIDMVPYGIRLICKQIRKLTLEFFPNADKYDIAALVGGFFILRFLNPAVVTPTAYHIVEGKLTPNARRNLTLLAKLLQLLSNMVDSFGKKEIYMAIFKGFYDLETDDELDQFLALSSENVTISVTLNELFFIHELFAKYSDKVIQDENDPLKTALDKMGEAPKQLDRDQNPTVQLTLANHYANPLSKERGNVLKMYQETKEMLATIYQQLLDGLKEEEVDAKIFVKNLQKLRNEAKASKDRKANRKIKRIMFNMKKLLKEKIISKNNNFKKLRSDVTNYIKQRQINHQRIVNESSLLMSVKESVDRHFDYLKNQLGIYREYLDNVRKQAFEKNQKTFKGSQQRKKKVMKFSHNELEKIGVLSDSEVPKERRTFVYFKISTTSSPGIFNFELCYKNKPNPLYVTNLHMETILEAQHNSEIFLELDHVALNVNFLIHLLKKNFL